MTNAEGRIQRLEMLLQATARQLRQVQGRLVDAEQAARVSQTGTMAGGGGGGQLIVGFAVSAISADGTGYVQPCDTTGGTWADVGAPIAVRNLNPSAGIAYGKRCACQVDQNGVMIASPLQC